MNARSAANGTAKRAHWYHLSKESRAPRLSHAARRAQVRSGARSRPRGRPPGRARPAEKSSAPATNSERAAPFVC